MLLRRLHAVRTETRLWLRSNSPIPFLSVTAVSALETLGAFCESLDWMVDVEEERLKVLASGARWVSFSSALHSASRPLRLE